MAIDAAVYVWRVRTRLPERFGERCTVLARGRKNSVLVQFERDGWKVITSRWYVRRLTGETDDAKS